MYRVRTTFDGVQGSPYLSTFYFSSALGSAQQAATAAGTFWNSVEPVMVSALNWTLERDVATIDAATGQTTAVTQVSANSGSGSAGAGPLPFSNQGLIRWRTGVFAGGREIRGRTFIPGPTETLSDEVPTAAYGTTINPAITALIGDANSTLVVWSRANGVEEDVTSGDLWNSWAVLRSRRD